jgi:hypothetical protein
MNNYQQQQKIALERQKKKLKQKHQIVVCMEYDEV